MQKRMKHYAWKAYLSSVLSLRRVEAFMQTDLWFSSGRAIFSDADTLPVCFYKPNPGGNILNFELRSS